jgi:DNA-directed RNA polymerase III subunit RPC7
VDAKPVATKKRMNIDEMNDEDEEKVCFHPSSCSYSCPEFIQETPSDASAAGSQAPESDYDVDEEYDNDYAENYFDNGENDDNDDLGGGGGGGDEGGGGLSCSLSLPAFKKVPNRLVFSGDYD